MATETHTIKIGKSTKNEIKQISSLLQECTWLSKEMKFKNLENIDFEGFEILNHFDKNNAEDFLESLVKAISNLFYEKAIMNLYTLLDNCADKDLDYLDFNPEIKKGLELLEQSAG